MVHADDTSSEDSFGIMAEKLSALGIVTETLEPDSTVSRGIFAGCVANFMNMQNYQYNNNDVVFADVPTLYRYFNHIMFLYESGIVSANDSGLFRTDDAVTLAEAARMLVKATGYDAYITEDSDTAYITTAMTQDIIPSISADSNGAITFRDMLKMFNKAIDAAIVQQRYNSYNQIEYYKSDQSAIYYYHRLLKITGTLLASGMRTADGGKSVAQNAVRIDDMVFDTQQQETYKLLGSYVDGYYKESSSDGELAYVGLNKRTEIKTIDGRQVKSYVDGRLTYYKSEESSASDSENFPKTAYMMYNYNNVTLLEDDDVLNARKIILTDNNGDGTWDTVNVVRDTTYFVAQVSASSETIYDKYGQKPLKTDDTRNFIVYDNVGNLKTLGDIKEQNVLSVMEDKSGENIIAYISTATVTGKVNSMNSADSYKDMVCNIDGSDYNLADNTELIMNIDELLKPGTGVTVYLNYMSEIGGVVYNDSFSEYRYGYVIRTYVPDGEETRSSIKMYTLDNIIKDFNCADSVTIDGKRFKDTSDIDSYLKSKNIDENSVKQIIKYKLNDDGEVSSILTTDYVDDSMLMQYENRFTRYNDLIDSYYSKDYRAYLGSIRVDMNTIIMYVPNNTSEETNISSYGVEKFADFASQTCEKVEVYNLSRDKTAGLIVIHAGNSLKESASVAVIQDIITVVDDAGNERYHLKAIVNGSEEEYDFTEECTPTKLYRGTDSNPVESTIKRGDMIRIVLNENDQICDYQKVFSLSDADDPTIVKRGNEYPEKNTYVGSQVNMISYSGNAYNPEKDVRCGRIWQGTDNNYWFTGIKFSMEFGIVQEIYGTTMIIQNYTGTSGDSKNNITTRYFNLTGNRVYIIDEVKDEIKIGSVEDIISADKVGQEKATRLIYGRYNDVPSFAAIIIRKD
jgi:hypothetical protein